jgi:competence protein ComEA
VRTEADRVAERVRALLGATVDAPTEEPERRARFAVRVDPGRRVVLVIGVVVLVVGAVVGGWILSARPESVPVSASASTRGRMPTGAVASPSASSTVSVAAVSVVDVAGKVRRPGIYRLPAGARVDDAVRAAGGALPGVSLDSLNLASRVSDGQQIAVGIASAPGLSSTTGIGSGSGSGVGGSAPVNLNSATLEQLQTLPGVGPVLAQHVLDWRAAHGSFRSVQQLNDVPGIGDVKFAALRQLVSV